MVAAVQWSVLHWSEYYFDGVFQKKKKSICFFIQVKPSVLISQTQSHAGLLQNKQPSTVMDLNLSAGMSQVLSGY